MTAVVAVLCGVLGLLIGSFLNVVIWRVPRGESVVRPPSHCPGCDRPIAPRDNVPVLSWLLLRGRCRHCATTIAIRYPLVEAGTALVFAVLAARLGPHAALPAFLVLAGFGVALAVIDLDIHRLPDVLTLPLYPLGIGLLAVAALVGHDGGSLLRAVTGMAALFGFYALTWVAYPAGMGVGDVKLSGVVGLYLAWLGWGQLAVGAFAGFLIGAVVSVGLVALRGATRKTAVPFGPFMLLGLLVGVLVGGPLATAYTSLVG